MILYKNYIGGEWVAGADIRVNINPSNTNDVIGEYSSSAGGKHRVMVRVNRAPMRLTFTQL